MNLDAIFRPRTVAIIGASKREGTLGHKVMSNLIRLGFEGILFPVNPKAEFIQGYKCYPSVTEIPEPVDLAILIVPRQAVPAVVEQCGEKGVKALIVISAGFREIGGDGVEREQRLVEQVKQYNMRMVGPNCMGVFNTAPDVRLDATFSPASPHPGNIGFISQSGALGAVILELANHLQLGISLFASMGNKADVSDNDLLEYYYTDPNTDLILMYLENLADPRRFLKIARRVTRQKPVIVVKAGKTKAGARAASSHTGALADSEVAINTLLQQCGVIRVPAIEEMFTLGMAFANQPLPAGNRVAVLTNAGGPGILATDALIGYGLVMAALSEQTRQRLREMLPEEASVNNPVDMISTATQDHYQSALEILLQDDQVDAVMVIFVTPILVKSYDVAHRIARVISQFPQKTVVTCLMGHEGVLSGVEELERHKIPVYRFPESAARALAAMNDYREFRERREGKIVTFPVDRESAAAAISAARRAGRTMLNNREVQQVLKAYGFRLAEYRLVQDADEAVTFAKHLNNPVVVKVMSGDIIHKTDVGGVQVDLRTGKDIRNAFAEIHKNIKEKSPGAKIEGFVVQEMIRNARESVLGISRDPKCGPVLMFGLGGIYVEVLQDVAFRIAPITDEDAEEMIRSLRGYPLLQGVRGEAPVNMDKLVENLLRLSQLAMDFPEIKELDMNPIMLSATAEGAKVVDARIVLGEEG